MPKNVQPTSSEEPLSENGVVGIESAKPNRKFLKFGGVSLAVLALAVVWVAREPIAEFAVQNYLQTKGVDGAIALGELGAKGASFTNLRIGPSGRETLTATNGHIGWHFDWDQRKLIIDELRANQLRANLALKDGKIDYGALAPLMKGGGKKLEIDKINLGLGEVYLATQYGLGTAQISLDGSLSDLAGSAAVILPSQFYIDQVPTAPIAVNFRARDLAQSKIKTISAHFAGQQQNLDLQKLLGAGNAQRLQTLGASADINVGMATNDVGESFFAIRPSVVTIAELRAGNADFHDFAINLSDANWRHKGNWAQSAIFDIAANINAGHAKFGGQTIGATNWDLHLRRGGDKQLDLEYRLSNSGLRGDIAAQSLAINGAVRGQASDLSQIRGMEFDGLANIEARNFGNSGSENLLQTLRNFHAEDLLNQSHANLHLNLRGTLADFAVSPIGAQKITGARGSDFSFAPSAAIGKNAIFVRNLDGNSQISGNIVGRIDFRSRSAGAASAHVTEGSFTNRMSRLNLAQINLRSLKYGQFTLNGAGGIAQFALTGSRINSGRVSANLLASSNGDLKMAQSPLELDLSVQNNRAQFVVAGRIANADFDGNRLQNTNFRANGTALLANGHLPITINSNVRASIGGLTSQNGAQANNFSISGPIQASISPRSVTLSGRNCLNTSITEIAFDDNSINNAKGALCPDARGRFATFENNNSHLFAATNIAALDLKLGSSGTANHISMAGVTGSFSQAPQGGILYVAAVPNLEFRFNTGPQTHATIRAANSRLVVHSRAGKTEMTADLRAIESEGLPVRTSGDMIMDMAFSDAGGTLGHFSFNNLLVGDTVSARRYADLGLGGTGELRNNQIYFEGNLAHAQSGADVATVRLNHNLQSGVGNAVFDAHSLKFKPRLLRTGPRDGFEIGEILPPLLGIFTDVEGTLAGHANFNWAPNQAVVSSAEVGSVALNFNTIIGQVENLAGTIHIDDLMALRTGTQIIRVGSFNPGIPILNGVLGFSLPGTNALKIEAASWPFADGNLSIEPSLWPFNNQDKSLTIKVDNIDIAQLLRLTNIPNLVIDGRMSGVLPVKIIENNAEIVGGILRSREGGGTIKYTGPSLAAAQPPPTMREKLARRFGVPIIPKNEALAEAALRNLQYKVLELRVDGRITGDMTLGMTIEGFNPELLNATQFRFTVNINLPVGQIISGIKNTADPCKQIEGRNIEELRELCPQEAPATDPSGVF